MGYADNIKLLCPSLKGMQKMVDMCVDYADAYNIKFNGSKHFYLKVDSVRIHRER